MNIINILCGVAIAICLFMLNTLIPFHVLASSKDCDVTSVNMPSGAAILSGELIRASVPYATRSITVNVTTSPNSSWKLYSDYKCTKEIGNKKLNLKKGSNYAYIKVTAQDNITTKRYILTVFREAISSACDVKAVALPNGAAIGVNTITAKVPKAKNSVIINVSTSNYASWKLYNDVNCTNEIVNKKLRLNLGNNNAYIKVTAQDNTTTKEYTLTITRAATAISSVSDVTQKVKVLGQPFLFKGTYPANVWDMQVFNGKIYLGFGNSSNKGPEANTGPIPIIYFDPPAGKFVTDNIRRYNSTTKSYETVKAVDEEQIDIYRVLNGKLYIPGHDSRESWAFGNYYVMDNNYWQKYRNIPNGVHVYDMGFFKGKLFAAIGSNQYVDKNNTSAIVLMSGDNGITWEEMGSIPSSMVYDGRVYTLFVFNSKLYAVDVLFPAWVPRSGGGYYSDIAKILCFEQDSAGKINTSNVTVNGSEMIPGVELDLNRGSLIKMVRVNIVNNKLLFIAGQCYNDHQWLPGGLYVAADINSAQKISLLEQNALPMDILVRGNTAYVLAYVKKSNKEYANIIYKSDDLITWTELFRFKKDTFARSFEELNGDFYFGLGCYTDYLPPSTGTILMVGSSTY